VTQDIRVTIDTAALRHNVATLRAAVAPARVMAVVKANGYGHGAVESARAFVEAGVDWLGVADLDEAVELREAGITAPVLAWLHAPGETFERAAAHDVTPAVSDVAQLEAAAAAGVRAVHLCVDTGLSRNGAVASEWPEFFARAAALADRLPVEGVMTHLSNASPEEDGAQVAAFLSAIETLGGLGVEPRLRHVAASAAALHFADVGQAPVDMVRFGLAAYGLSPFPDRSAADLGLRPALTMRAPVTTVKRVPAGEGVSYGYVFRPERDTTIAVVPVGYSDGVDRAASDRASVTIGQRTYRVRGRIAMNALVIDVGDDPVEVGDEVVLFGDPALGHQGAEDWARAFDGITYEVVASLSARLPRSWA
jgi:alanine racemase